MDSVDGTVAQEQRSRRGEAERNIGRRTETEVAMAMRGKHQLEEYGLGLNGEERSSNGRLVVRWLKKEKKDIE